MAFSHNHELLEEDDSSRFPEKLFKILSSEDKSLISWDADGSSFRIHNEPVFARGILPKYFQTKKIESFKRQLNLYGYRKVIPYNGSYYHKNFRREDSSLLTLIRKKKTKIRKLKMPLLETVKKPKVEKKIKNVKVCGCKRHINPVTSNSFLPTSLINSSKLETIQYTDLTASTDYHSFARKIEALPTFSAILSQTKYFDDMFILSSLDHKFEDLGITFTGKVDLTENDTNISLHLFNHDYQSH